jgi:predicted nuclease with TOPRIM domain
VKSIQELKAANDNLVSKTTALEAQLKAANDNIEELRHELRDLKNGVGFKRVVGQ